VDRSQKWINLFLRQHRRFVSKKRGSSGEPSSSTETRKYKRLKNVVEMVETTTEDEHVVA
jgi:hypothetical protein